MAGKPDYNGEVQAKFDRLLLALVRFVRLRIDGDGTRFPYLRRIEAEKPPGEAELQDDLLGFLTTSDYADAERKHVSAGRVDIIVPQGSFRFIIEVKRLLTTWREASLQPLLRQTTAYQQTDVRLGVLAVLDLSDRPAGHPHFDECFEVRDLADDSGKTRTAVIVRTPGNRRTPSDHATPNADPI